MKLIIASDHGGYSLKKQLTETIHLLKDSEKKSESSLSLLNNLKLKYPETFSKHINLEFLNQLEISDLGCYDENSVNYPEYAAAVCSQLLAKTDTFSSSEDSLNHHILGVLICGSGQGMAIKANKFKKIRAALVWNEEIAKLCREHNNANVLCLPGRFISVDTGLNCLFSFLTTPFAGGRHAQRVDLID